MRIEVKGHSRREALTEFTKLIGDSGEFQAVTMESNWYSTCVVIHLLFLRERKPLFIGESNKVWSID